MYTECGSVWQKYAQQRIIHNFCNTMPNNHRVFTVKPKAFVRCCQNRVTDRINNPLKPDWVYERCKRLMLAWRWKPFGTKIHRQKLLRAGYASRQTRVCVFVCVASLVTQKTTNSTSLALKQMYVHADLFSLSLSLSIRKTCIVHVNLWFTCIFLYSEAAIKWCFGSSLSYWIFTEVRSKQKRA